MSNVIAVATAVGISEAMLVNRMVERQYKHVTEDEQEIIFCHHKRGESFAQIARMLNLTEKPVIAAYYRYCKRTGEKP